MLVKNYIGRFMVLYIAFQKMSMGQYIGEIDFCRHCDFV